MPGRDNWKAGLWRANRKLDYSVQAGFWVLSRCPLKWKLNSVCTQAGAELSSVLVCTQVGAGFCAGVHAIKHLGFVLVCTQAGAGYYVGVPRNREAFFCVGVERNGKHFFMLVCTQGGSWVLCWCARKREAGLCADVLTSGTNTGLCAGAHSSALGLGSGVQSGVHKIGEARYQSDVHGSEKLGFCAGVHASGLLGSKLMCTQAGSPELSRVLCWCARK